MHKQSVISLQCLHKSLRNKFSYLLAESLTTQSKRCYKCYLITLYLQKMLVKNVCRHIYLWQWRQHIANS